MAALNEAYQGQNLAVLKMLALEARLPPSIQPFPSPGRPKDPAKALEYETARCRRRAREVRAEIEGLHQDPSVQLSFDVKLARREAGFVGRDGC